MHQSNSQLHPGLGQRLLQQDGVQEADLQERYDSGHAEVGFEQVPLCYSICLFMKLTVQCQEHEKAPVLPRLDLVLPGQRDEAVHRAGQHGGCQKLNTCKKSMHIDTFEDILVIQLIIYNGRRKIFPNLIVDQQLDQYSLQAII